MSKTGYGILRIPRNHLPSQHFAQAITGEPCGLEDATPEEIEDHASVMAEWGHGLPQGFADRIATVAQNREAGIVGIYQPK